VIVIQAPFHILQIWLCWKEIPTMTRFLKAAFGVLALVTAVAVAPRAVASADTQTITHAILTTAGVRVGSATGLCATGFNYVQIGFNAPHPSGVTVYFKPVGGSLQIIATTTSSLPFVTAFPNACPAAGSGLGVVDNATGQVALGQFF
jgi:hypothetical protein